METLRNLLLSSFPSSILVPCLKLTFAFPPKIARGILADFIAPKNDQKSWIKTIEEPLWKGAWIGPSIEGCCDKNMKRMIQDADIIIFKAHGGGFRVGNCTMYMDIFIKWIELLKQKFNMNALILSVDYSLAPEVAYPVPVLECVAAYEYLVKTLKISPSKIVLSGDSAGGALIYEMLIRIYAPAMLESMDGPRINYNYDIPAGLFLSSPAITTNTSNWDWAEYKDDLVSPELITCIMKEYLRLPDSHPDDLHVLKIAHIRKGFERFTPQNVMMYYGGREVMNSSVLEMAEAMKYNSNLNVITRKEDLYHDWYFIRQLIPNRYLHIFDDCDDQFVNFVARSVKEATSKTV